MDKFIKVFKRFYIVFSVCFFVVAVLGGMYVYKFINNHALNKISYSLPSVYVEGNKNEQAPVTATKTDINKEELPEKRENKEDEIINVMSVVNEEKPVIEKPVKNKVLNGYTGDELIYSKTFDDYRVHNGIDIKAERGDAVKCAYDGVVEDVYADSLCGIVITVNHGNGYKTVYKNLSSDKMVKKGESVTKGQTISGVGETAIFEAAEDSHVHFELIYNEEYVNPEEYFE